MKITGESRVQAPVAQVWDALLEPEVLVRTIPGCERLEEIAEHDYAMTVTAGVAAIRGTYTGSCRLSDLVPQESLVMTVQAAGAPGTVGATVQVRFAEEDGATRIEYDAEAVVGGMVGGVGQRMLSSVSRRMAGEFFGNLEQALVAPGPAPEEAGDGAAQRPGMPRVYADAPRPGRVPLEEASFGKGVAVGASLVLLGVLAGARLARRR